MEPDALDRWSRQLLDGTYSDDSNTDSADMSTADTDADPEMPELVSVDW